jgi:hypothetical protein
MNSDPQAKPRNQADFRAKTDSEGRAVWTHAPDEVLHFSIYKGDSRRDDIELKPDGEEHVLALATQSLQLTLVGSVRDADTGNLLPSFRIIVGWPITNYQTGELGGQWSQIDRFWLKFDGGNFRHTFTEPAIQADPNPGFIFKFEADGYAPFVTRSFIGNEGEVPMDVTMRPSPPLQIIVLLPDGQPAANADVGLVSANSRLTLAPGRFSRRHFPASESLLLTDQAGKLALPLDGTVREIVIAHPQGFGRVPVAELATNQTIQLQPWSRIEGTLLYDSQPAPNREVEFQLKRVNPASIGVDHEKFTARTDALGQFVFPQVPTGENRLSLKVITDNSPLHHSWRSWTLTNMDIPAGETVTVSTSTTIPPNGKSPQTVNQ